MCVCVWVIYKFCIMKNTKQFGHSINFEFKMYKLAFIQNIDIDTFYRNEQTSMKAL